MLRQFCADKLSACQLRYNIWLDWTLERASAVQDLSPEYAGALLGLSNTAGALPGILGVTSVGFLLDKTQSWGASLFYPTAICQVVGLIVYTTFASSKRQSWATD